MANHSGDAMNTAHWIRTCGLATALSLSLFAQTNFENAMKNLRFRSIGPATMGGRIDDFAVVESDPRIIYVGAAAGGIFKTVNGGDDLAAHLRGPAQSLHRRSRAGALQSLDPLRGHRRSQTTAKVPPGATASTNPWTAAPPAPTSASTRPTTSAASWCTPPIPTSSTSPRWATCGDPTRSAAST